MKSVSLNYPKRDGAVDSEPGTATSRFKRRIALLFFSQMWRRFGAFLRSACYADAAAARTIDGTSDPQPVTPAKSPSANARRQSGTSRSKRYTRRARYGFAGNPLERAPSANRSL
jgi:hypothetical protein